LILYCSPKPTFTLQDRMSLVIEPQDIARVPLNDALESDLIWKVAMWGTPRDYELIKKLSKLKNVETIAKERCWIHGEGYIEGRKKKFPTTDLFGKLEVTPEDLQKYVIDKRSLKPCLKDHFYRWGKTKLQIYKGPHLLIRQSPTMKNGFASAVMPEDSVFSQSIVGIHSDPKYLSDLIAVCEAINSDLPLYFAMLTSGRWLVERDELTKDETMSIPIPSEILNGNLDMAFLEKLSTDRDFREIENNRLLQLYGLTETEKILIHDTIRYALGYFIRKLDSEAVQPADNSHIKEYVLTLCETLNHQFSTSNRGFCGTIFLSDSPLRIVILKLTSQPNQDVCEELGENEMKQQLKEIDEGLIEEKAGSVYVRRNLRRYGKNSVSIIKPNQTRYWTRSLAITDADIIYADIMTAWRVN
jgi:hypothetical protein